VTHPVYVDEDGAITQDPAAAIAGEIFEEDAAGDRRKIGWFGLPEVELAWLPVRESVFLLWVLASLAIVWLIIGLVLRLT
jgi:hypothetical protein